MRTLTATMTTIGGPNFRAIARLAAAALFFCSSQSGFAVDWFTETVPGFSASGAAYRSAIACDRADRDHLVFASSDGANRSLNYVLRANRTAALSSRILSTTAFSHVAIDVTPDFRVYVAGVRTSDGAVLVYEFKEGEATVVATAATAASNSLTGGVSIVAEGNGMSRTSVAYTGTDGRARFVRRTGAGTWGTPVQATSGLNSGLMPVLVSLEENLSEPAFFPYAVISYNSTSRQMQVANYSSLISIWTAAENIGPQLEEFAIVRSIAVDVFLGKPGVAFSSTESTLSVRYAERASSGSGWTVQTVSAASELEPSSGHFGDVALRFDAEGHPMVAYAVDRSTASDFTRLDLRMRRFIPGFSWSELSIITSFPRDCGAGVSCGRTGPIAMSTNGSGDPRLLFGGAFRGPSHTVTDPVIASPGAVQWPVTTADAVAAYTFAPAMATLPDGGRCLVVGTAAASGIFGARTYQSPRLTIYRGAGTSMIPLPSSALPHLANAVTSTADGVIHVVSLRTANDAAATTSGDLLYFRIEGSTVTATTVVDDNGSEVNIAARDQIALGADATGRLYLAFSGGTSRELKLLTLAPDADLAPGQRPWETLASIPGYYRAIDLAARTDGGVLISYYKRSPDEVGVYTNIEPKSGDLLAAFGEIRVYQRPALVTAEATNTACAFDVRGLPRLAFAFSGDFIVATSRRSDLSGDPFAITFSAPGSFSDAHVDMACTGTTINIAILDGAAGRALWLMEGRANAASFTPTGYAQMATLGLAPSSLGGGVALAMDHDGFGTIGAGLVSTGLIVSFHDVYIARDPNGLDRDGDGVPLLYENAFCMDPYAADAELMPRPSVVKFNAAGEGEILLSQFQHRFPSVPATTLSNGAAFQNGQFHYSLSISNDLKAASRYSTNTPIAGIFPALAPLGEVSPGVAEEVIGLRADATYRSTHPRAFFGLLVKRFR